MACKASPSAFDSVICAVTISQFPFHLYCTAPAQPKNLKFPISNPCSLSFLSSIITPMWPEAEKTEELLAGVRGGDAEAINRLMNRHRDSIRRMVQLRLDQKIQRRIDASDVVQDVLVEASRRLQDYLANPVMSFHLWLRQIAQDRIIDAHRRHRVSAKRSVDRERVLAVPSADDHSTMDLAAQLVGHELTPAAAATQKE